MVLSVALVVAAWMALSVPAALVVGRMFAAGHVTPVAASRAAVADADRVAYLSRIESRRVAASRWPHEARVLCESRRGHSAVSVGVGRSAG